MNAAEWALLIGLTLGSVCGYGYCYIRMSERQGRERVRRFADTLIAKRWTPTTAQLDDWERMAVNGWGLDAAHVTGLVDYCRQLIDHNASLHAEKLMAEAGLRRERKDAA